MKTTTTVYTKQGQTLIGHPTETSSTLKEIKEMVQDSINRLSVFTLLLENGFIIIKAEDILAIRVVEVLPTTSRKAVVF